MTLNELKKAYVEADGITAAKRKQEQIDSLNLQIKSLFAVAGELVLYGRTINSGHP